MLEAIQSSLASAEACKGLVRKPPQTAMPIGTKGLKESVELSADNAKGQNKIPNTSLHPCFHDVYGRSQTSSFFALSRAKVLSEIASVFTAFTSIFVEVAITYFAFTRRSGTPFTFVARCSTAPPGC